MFDPSKSLQDQFAPHNACFGCGPANVQGLRIKSFVQDNMVTAAWRGETHHEAFPGMLNGGIIGALLDCHSNWTAAYYLMKFANADRPPCTVTAYFNVTLKRPTPSFADIKLFAEVEEIKPDQAIIQAKLMFEDKICALCTGKFVAVKEGHPAFHRW